MNTIDLKTLIGDRLKDFSGREWVFRQVDNWVNTPGESPVFLISGEPGSGKSAIMARLSQNHAGIDGEIKGLPRAGYHVAFAHFCQSQVQVSQLPLRFLESFSKELSNRFPVFGNALLNQADPHLSIINVNQKVGVAEAGSQVHAVYIEAVHISNISSKLAFDQAVRRPLEVLYTSGYQEPLIILVDALDEAYSTDSDDDLVNLLGHSFQNPTDLPPNVKWILTCRSDPRIFRILNHKPDVNLSEYSSSDQEDVRLYARRRLASFPETNRTVLANRLAEASDGNFLYARYMLDDWLARPDEINPAKAVIFPKGLSGIYGQFLGRELASSKKRWTDRFRSLLGLLSVAQGEGLTHQQLVEVTGFRNSEVSDFLSVSSQYLSGNQPEGPFTLYHQSFRDYLQEQKEYPIYPDEAHQQMADILIRWVNEETGQGWNEYAFHYLLYHLNKADRRKQLNDILLSARWLLGRLAAKDFSSLINDFNYLEDQKAARSIQEAIRLSAHILIEDPNQFWGQLSGRLIGQESEEVTRLLKINPSRVWLRPLTPSLEPSGGPQICTLTGHSKEVIFTAVIKNGQQVLSCSKDGSLKIWDIFLANEIASMEEEQPAQEWITCSLTSNGHYAVTVSAQGNARIWDLENRCPANNKLFTGIQKAIAVKDDRVLLADSGDALKLWDSRQPDDLLELSRGAGGRIIALTVTRDGHWAIVASSRGGLAFYDLDEPGKAFYLNDQPFSFDRHIENIIELVASHSGRILLSGSRGHNTKMWDIQSRTWLHSLRQDAANIHAICIDTSEKWVLTSSEDQEVVVWDLTSGKGRTLLPGTTNLMESRLIALLGHHALVTSYPGRLQIWDLEEQSEPQAIDKSKQLLNPKKPGDDIIAAAGEILAVNAHAERITALATDEIHRLIITASANGTIKAWQLANTPARHVVSHSSQVASVLAVQQGKYAVSFDGQSKVIVWDVARQQEIASLDDCFQPLMITQSEDIFVYLDYDNLVHSIEIATGKVLANVRFHNDPEKTFNWLKSLTFDSKSGEAIYHRQNQFKMTDLYSGKQTQTIPVSKGGKEKEAEEPFSWHRLLEDDRNYLTDTLGSTGAILYEGDSPLQLDVWDLKDPTLLYSRAYENDLKYCALCLFQRGSRLALALSDDDFHFFDLAKGTVKEIKGNNVFTNQSKERKDHPFDLVTVIDGPFLYSHSITMKYIPGTRHVMVTSYYHSSFSYESPDNQFFARCQVWNFNLAVKISDQVQKIDIQNLVKKRERATRLTNQFTLAIGLPLEGHSRLKIPAYEIYHRIDADAIIRSPFLISNSPTRRRLNPQSEQESKGQNSIFMLPRLMITPDKTRALARTAPTTLTVWRLGEAVFAGPQGTQLRVRFSPETLQIIDEQGHMLAGFRGDSPLTEYAICGENQILIVGEMSGELHFLKLCDIQERGRRG